jgi:hypothetical protein
MSDQRLQPIIDHTTAPRRAHHQAFHRRFRHPFSHPDNAAKNTSPQRKRSFASNIFCHRIYMSSTPKVREQQALLSWGLT